MSGRVLVKKPFQNNWYLDTTESIEIWFGSF